MRYAGMSAAAIAEAITARRRDGYPGGMPTGAEIDEEEALEILKHESEENTPTDNKPDEMNDMRESRWS